MVVDADRDRAIARLARALDEMVVTGIQTTLPFHRFVARHAGFRAGDLSIDWVDAGVGAAVEAEPRDRARRPRRGRRPRPRPAATASVGTRRPRSARTAGHGGRSGWARDGRTRAVGPVAAMTGRVRVAPTPASALPADRPVDRRARRSRRGLRRAVRRSGASSSTAATDLDRWAPRRPGAPARRTAGPAVEVVVDGWRFELEVEDDAPGRRSASGRRGRRTRPRPAGPLEVRADHSRAGRRGRGRRRATRSRPAQTLLVVEAMKMQNELRAPRAGRVERVAVGAGDTIELRRPAGGDRVSDARRADRAAGATATRAKALKSAPGAAGAVRHELATSRSPTSTPPPTSRRPASIPSATSACRASSRSPAASSRRCTAAGSGRCASTPASRPPRRRTTGSATSSSRARPACRSRSTCRPRWATTRTRPQAAGEVGRVGVPISSASPTWRSCSRACRSARSARR